VRPVPLDDEIIVKGDGLHPVHLELIESTAADYCSSTRTEETGRESRRLYRCPSKRPDSRDRNPSFSYLQAAVRLLMSLHGTSRAEFEAVVARLAQSAKMFSTGSVSRNYLAQIMRLLG